MWKNIALALLTFLFVNSSLAQIQVPAFSFKTLEDKEFTQAQLDANKPTMIMNYDPYCDHCNEQAEIIRKAASKFKEKNVQFVFVTFIPEKEATEEFIKTHFEGTELDYTFLLDPEIQFESYFGYTDDALNIFLYKAKGGKPKYFGEEQSAETLLNNL